MIKPRRFIGTACAAAFGLVHSVQAKLPNDSLFQYQWPLKNSGGQLCTGCTVNKVGADMHMEQAWDITTGDSSIIIAILDTGCKWKLPDFAGRIWINKGEIQGNGIDDDGNGLVDDVRGWDFHDNDNDPDDIDGHGTSIASVIGSASNDRLGFAGVDWKCKLMILRDGRDSSGLLDNTSKAIRYAIKMKARVINISRGDTAAALTTEYKDAVAAAIQAGIVVVAGSANNGIEKISVIAQLPGVIAVGATGPDDRRAKGLNPGSAPSNYGDRLDLVAPGDYIPVLDISSNQPYDQMASGTSMATAQVSGVVALLLAQDPRRTPAQIRDILCSSADDLVGDPLEDTPGRDKYYGCGRVNAFRALSQISSIRPPRPSLSQKLNSQIVALNLFTVDGRRVIKSVPAFGIQGFGLTKP
ncbi:MAG: S8 family serine peptidase [Fibrobacteres bacterium]|jgi:thermitase|nr:S8 family serine peptidase [Fibrobacterota bacterium]